MRNPISLAKAYEIAHAIHGDAAEGFLLAAFRFGRLETSAAIYEINRIPRPDGPLPRSFWTRVCDQRLHGHVNWLGSWAQYVRRPEDGGLHLAQDIVVFGVSLCEILDLTEPSTQAPSGPGRPGRESARAERALRELYPSSVPDSVSHADLHRAVHEWCGQQKLASVSLDTVKRARRRLGGVPAE